MGWFPSLICKNCIFKHSVKTAEATSLKFCVILKLITLHLEQTIAQLKYANLSNAHVQTFVLLKQTNGNSFYLLQKAEILVVVTLDCLLPEINRLLKDLFV